MALDLDIWTAEIISRELGGRPDLAFASLREAIDKYTEEKRRESFEYAKANSDFYAVRFEGIDCEVWEEIPFTTPEQLREEGAAFLCADASEEGGIITMQTSGATGEPKKIRFTEGDQKRMADYYDHSLQLIIDETDTVLILLPAEQEGSIGKVIGESVERIGAKAIVYGVPFVTDAAAAEQEAASSEEEDSGAWKQSRKTEEAEKLLQLIRDERVTCVAATPTHMVALARAMERQVAAGAEEIYLRSILLGGEFVPDKTVMMLEEAFQAMIFEHYGMTEMGLGGAVSCGYGKGSHIREADLYIELINPITGEVVQGESPKTPGYSPYGEIVITTLTRKGMPLIRYRTGDYSRWILGQCPCGSQLKRLDKIYPGEERK